MNSDYSKREIDTFIKEIVQKKKDKYFLKGNQINTSRLKRKGDIRKAIVEAKKYEDK